MAYTAIDDPSAYFKVQLYTGNGSANHAITFDDTDTDMQPDFVWIKNRDATDSHCLFDSVRGATKVIHSDTTGTETTDADTLDSFASDGFQVDADVKVNTNTEDYIAWCWKAGTAFSNDASGTSIGNTDSSGSASSTAGFSICKYTGAGASLDITVKHGLGAVPHVMIIKNLEDANSGPVYHHKNTAAPETDYLKLDTDATTADQGEVWLDTAPTSAIFTAGDFSGSNRSGDDFVGYFWNEVQGFSKFGSYTGNGNADGTFVYTGFKPAYILLKNTTTSSRDWMIYDNKRAGYNGLNNYMVANTTGTDQTGIEIDLLSNGFKPRSTATGLNASGVVHVYMAFAEAPFVNSKGAPANAR